MSSIIRARGLSRSFGDLNAVDQIDLDVTVLYLALSQRAEHHDGHHHLSHLTAADDGHVGKLSQQNVDHGHDHHQKEHGPGYPVQAGSETQQSFF